MSPSTTYSLATRAIHADADHELNGPAVAPPMSVSTTFRHPSPEMLAAAEPGFYDEKWDPSAPSRDIYSRYTQPTLTRAEKVLTSIIGQPTILFPSGIASCAAVLNLVLPDVIAITEGYHGCHAAIEVYRRTRPGVTVIKVEDEYPKKGKLLQWLETPKNPTGECESIEFYAKKAHAVNGTVAVDATFAPPPISDPFKWGCDIVIHSATKYLGGHTDLLAGTVSVKTKEQWSTLWHNRTYTGTNIGSMDAWLLLRSLRTLAVRVPRQAESATALAQWLCSLTRATPGSSLDGPADVIEQVWHVTLQDNARELVGKGKQMEMGSACFAFTCTKPSYAKALPHALRLFTPATSLGGCESLIEQRVVSDPGADPRLIRLSIGLESVEDLKADLIQGMHKIVALEKGQVSKL